MKTYRTVLAVNQEENSITLGPLKNEECSGEIGRPEQDCIGQEEFVKGLDVMSELTMPNQARAILSNYTRFKGESGRAHLKRLKKMKAPREIIQAVESDLPELESEVQMRIFVWADSLGMFPIKIESQGTFDPRTGMRRKIVGGTKRKGVSDLFFTVGGRLHVCEVKTPDEYGYILRNWDKIRNHIPEPVPKRKKGEKKPKKKDDKKIRYQEQMLFIEKMVELGHVGFFADSLERVCIELMKNPHLLTPLQLREVSRLAVLPL